MVESLLAIVNLWYYAWLHGHVITESIMVKDLGLGHDICRFQLSACVRQPYTDNSEKEENK